MALLKANTGIGTTNPTSALHVFGDGRITGVVTASSFFGSGSNLTGIVTSLVAGTNITIVQSSGIATISASGGGGTQTLDQTLGYGNTSSLGMSVGVVTASSFVKSGGTSTQFLKADGSVDTTSYASQTYVGLATVGLSSVSYVNNQVGLATVGLASVSYVNNQVGLATSGLLSSTGSGSNLTGIVTSLVAGTNITLSGSTGRVTINASGGGTGIGTQWITTSAGIHTLSNVAIGTINPQTALYLDGAIGFVNDNIRIGNNQTLSGATGSSNICMGNFSGASISSGTRNVLIGDYSNAFGLDGSYNVMVGYRGYTQGNHNIHIGEYHAGGSGNYQVLIGSGDGTNNYNFGLPDASKDLQFAIGVNTTGNNVSNSKYWIVGNEQFNIGIGTENPTSKLHVVGDANISGNVTASSFSGNASSATYATISGVATALQNARTISLSGDVSGSISFDGTQNVSIAATIQPNSVALGTDTTGDYVQSISGTANQITVTGGTGEGSTPTLSIPSQFTAPQDVTVARDLQVNRNLNVNGNITIGGTSATLFTSELKVTDPDLVLGFRTDAFGNDISTDNTANHGGIAIASTEGSPLVQLFIAGIETTPATYKKLMWFKAGSFSGLGTDAWLSNYAVGIGSTQFPVGTRLAAGNVQITQDDLLVVRNINASGIVTALSFSGNASSATYSSTAGIATYATTSGVSTYSSSSGISTYSSTAGIATVAQGLTGTPNITVGILTATSVNATHFGSGTNLTGIVTSIVAGTNITISGSTGQVTINSTATGGGTVTPSIDLLEVMLFS